VSGGADSLALLVLAAATGRPVEVVHVDHGLRPGSGDDAEVVADAAERFGATFRAERIVVPDGPNLEARARAARLSVLPSDSATGHTMDDQAETVLANLLRGAGSDGVAGMRPGPRHPMLALRRSETREICRAMDLRWVEDPSNDDPRFVRNRIRHELLPLCAAVACRDPVPVLARHAEVVRDEADLLDRLAAEAVPDPSNAHQLSEAPLALARRAVRRWLRESGPPGHQGHDERYPPGFEDVNKVLAVAARGPSAAELAGGRRVRRSKGYLVVEPKSSGKVSAVTTEEAARVAPGWALPAVGPQLVSAQQVSAKVAELGARITADYQGHPPLLVGVLKGAMMFMSDLCRAIELPVDVDFMAVSSYGSATRSSGVVRIVKDLDAELTGRHVLVVEDIIDSGLTLNYLRRYLVARQPASVEVCALLVKEGVQRIEQDLRYVGFRIPSEFVVGYGLDAGERYRNLAGVHLYLGDPSGGPAAAAPEEDTSGRR
jgi:hypoxanthine phosphoribosyltransferase